jgi:hypothetical protein
MGCERLETYEPFGYLGRISTTEHFTAIRPALPDVGLQCGLARRLDY